MTPTPSSGVSLLQSGVVAAVVAAAVSVATLLTAGHRARLDRQRQLFADGFEACAAYREFAFIVRRRADNSPQEREKVSAPLSEVQTRIVSLEARIRVEAPRVGTAYARLVAETRRVAGAQIRAGWDADPLPAGETGRVTDVDLSPLRAPQDDYLGAVRDHLGFGPAWLRSVVRRARNRLRGDR